MALTSEMDIIELDEFVPANQTDPAKVVEMQRRFRTLFLERNQNRMVGGMGFVCKAYDSSLEPIAIKRLNINMPGEDATEEEIRRAKGMKVIFDEEYKNHVTLSKLKGFPHLYGRGSIAGNPIILMEWVEGITLKHATEHLPLDPSGVGLASPVVADIGIAVLDVLSTLARLAEPLVHRDLSPGNVMIRTSRLSLEEQLKQGRLDICLIDFGSATMLDEDSFNFTMVSDIWRNGTPLYAPPEMLTHDIAQLEQLRKSPKIDVYALCSILYELYSGRPPYRLADKPGVSPYRQKTEGNPEWLVPRTPEDTDLTTTIMRGLIIKQDMRPSAQELFEVLDAWRKGSLPPGGYSYLEGAGSGSGNYGRNVATQPADVTNGRFTLTGGLRRTKPGTITASLGTGSSEAKKRKLKSRVMTGLAAALVVGALGVNIAYKYFNSKPAVPSQQLMASQIAQMEPGNNAGAQDEKPDLDGATLFPAQDSSNNLWGFVDAKQNWVIKPQFKQMPGSFSEGLASAVDEQAQRVGYLDEKGEWAIEPTLAAGGNFSEGLAPARDFKTLLWGFIDKTGAWVISPRFSKAGTFHESLAAALDNKTSLWGYVNKEGAWVIDPSLSDAAAFADNGLAAAQKDGKWGYIKTDGTWGIEPVFAEVRDFHGGLAAVKNELWGYVNAEGTQVIAQKFEDARPFSEGYAAVKDKNGLWGFIDSEGDYKVSPTFAGLGEFQSGLAPAKDAESGLWGYVDKKGKWVVEAQFAGAGRRSL